ncbi:MAG: glycosyltransferase family 4 protein [Patescibacteria group bacterium]
MPLKTSKKKKILLYTDTTQIGGAEGHMLSLARFLDKEKFEVSLLCSRHDRLNEWCKKMKDEGVHVMRLIAKYKHNPRHYFSLKEKIEDLQINLLHAHIWNPASGRYAYMAAKAMKTPLITTEHDPFVLSPLKNFIKKKLIKNIAHLIAISEKNRDLLEKNYPTLKDKTSVIANGIDLEKFEFQLASFTKENHAEIRKNIFKVSEKTPVIITVAELHPRKGLLYLLEAAKKIQEKNTDFKIIIVGSGPQKKVLEKKIQKLGLEREISLLGYQHNIPHLLAASDMFVLPSLNEAFGLVLLEAMAAKLPIIATKNGGIPEIITNNVTGLLVLPAESSELAYAILRLLKNKDLAHRLAQEGHKLVKKSFDVRDMVKKTEEVYNTILKTL